MFNEQVLEANAKLFIMKRALQSLVEQCEQRGEDGYTCSYCNSGPEHAENCVYQTALDLVNTDVGDTALLDELDRLQKETERADTCDNARLEGISARLDGKPFIGNPYVNDDETSLAAREIWKMGWLEQDEEIRVNAILSSLRRYKSAKQEHPTESETLKRVETLLFKQLEDFERREQEKKER